MRSIRPTFEPLEKRYALAASLSVTGPRDAVFEGESLEFTLRLSEASRQVETVFVSTADGTATYGSDYFAMASQQIQFSPGQTMKTVTVRSLRDSGTARAEGVETFTVIARPANAALGTARAIGRIADYAPPPRITVGDVSLNEGNSGRSDATFTITLSAAAVKTVTVAYATADLSATLAESDYVAASGTLTFAPGETRKTVNVGINGDRKLESNETFSFTLSAPTNADLGQSRALGTIVNDEVDAPGFQITLNYTNPAIPAAQKQVFERAAARLQQVIIGDVPGVAAADGTFIDDMLIDVYVESMDPGLNGFALATAWRPGAAGLPYAGEIHLNSARIGNPGIYHTAIHEMLHTLGFYSGMFTATNNASGLGTPTPLFTGANAVREYASYFGLASAPGVPLYGSPAPGSYGSHWDTDTIGVEIMSVGWDTTSTALRPFSRITIGSLQDIGYSVNYAAADAYTRPPADRTLDRAQAAVVTSNGTTTSGSGTGGSAKTSQSRVTTPVATPIRPAVKSVAPVVATPRPATTPATKPAAPVRTPVVTTAPRPSTSVSTSGIRRF